MIAAACLLALAGIAITAPHEVVRPACACYVAAPRAASPADQAASENPDGLPVSLLIQNNGDVDDRLLGGSTPVAQCVDVRRAFLVHGLRETAPITEGFVIPAEATISLEPGRSHLALFGLWTDLVQGETFPLTLRFERAGEVTIVVRVRRRVDAAGVEPLPEVSLGDLIISLGSAPPAPGR